MDKNKYVEAFIQTMMYSMHSKIVSTSTKLSQGEEGVLRNLYISKTPLTPGQLQEQLYVVSGRIANILKTLEEKHMVIRATDPEDSRRTLVSLTKQGRRHVEENYQKFAAALERFVNEYGEEEYYSFLKEMQRFAKAFSEINNKEDK